MSAKCFNCGGFASLVNGEYDVEVGDRTVTVWGEFYRCDSCSETYVRPDQMDALQRSASAVIREEAGLLTGDEVCAFRSHLGLSQQDFEKLLGVGKRTVGRWERGTVFPSSAVDTLLRILMRHPRVVMELAEERGLELASGYVAQPSQSLASAEAAFEIESMGADVIQMRVVRSTRAPIEEPSDLFALSA